MAPGTLPFPNADAMGNALVGQKLIGDTHYFIDYPEDTQLVGVSFATTLGSVALSGEVNHKSDLPLQINAGQLIAHSVGNGAATPSTYSTILENDVNSVAAGGTIQGYRLFDVSQAQVTAIQFFDRVLGSDRITFVGEAGYTFIHDFEEGDNQIRFGRSDIYDGTGGDGFVTESSWGYRVMINADYSDAFAGVNLKPSIAWSEDVDGYAPQPGGAFNEGEQALNLSVAADYLSIYKASISYTQYMGGDYSVVSDRDYASISVGMQF